jgi:hypothetical protein
MLGHVFSSSGAQSRSLEEVRMQLANKSIELSGLKDECRALRVQVKDTSAMVEEGKVTIVELLMECQRKDAEIRRLRTSNNTYGDLQASTNSQSHASATAWPPSSRTTRSSFENPAAASSGSAAAQPGDSSSVMERSNALLRHSVSSLSG